MKLAIWHGCRFSHGYFAGKTAFLAGGIERVTKPGHLKRRDGSKPWEYASSASRRPPRGLLASALLYWLMPFQKLLTIGLAVGEFPPSSGFAFQPFSGRR